MSKICTCPSPPGGHIVCEDDQFGMCAWKDGKKVGGCLDVPRDVVRIEDSRARNIATLNWVLTKITGQVRAYDQTIDEGELKMLQSGEYATPDGKHVARFMLPKDFDLDGYTGVVYQTV